MARVPPSLGWPLLPLPDASGRLRWPELEDSIRQSVQTILQTRPGEQLQHPRFGAGLQDYLGRPDTLTTRRSLEDRVTQALTRWEDRILLDGVHVRDDDRPGRVRIDIHFRVRRTGTARRLGLTLALENG